MEGNDILKRTWLCLVQFGHVGMGNGLEGYICVFADDIHRARWKARYFPGVKTQRPVLEIEEV